MEEIETLKKELDQLKVQAEEYLNGWKRAKADFINREKEIEKEREAWIKFANQDFAHALLPFVDSFHAALAALPQEMHDSEWAQGFKQLGNNLEEVLRSVGVEPVESITAQFDPSLHECVGTEKGDKPGAVLREVQKGYLLRGWVLRPAKVIVSE